MKLSEAMRKGSKQMKQHFGDWSTGRGDGCALTLTAVGAGLVNKEADRTRLLYAAYDLIKMYPVLSADVESPCDCGGHFAVYHMIQHLNDRHFWKAERIAGWLESHVEVPTYSMLEIQEFMGEPIKEKELVYVRECDNGSPR